MFSSLKLFPAALIVGAALHFPLAKARAQEPAALKPSSNWNVDYGEQNCRLARTFGKGEDRHAIFFEQWAPGNSFGFTAAGKGFRRFNRNSRTYLKLHDDHERLRVNPMIGDLNNVGKAIIFANLDLEESELPLERVLRNQLKPPTDDENSETAISRALPEILSQVKYMSFTQGSRAVTLQTGSLAEPFKVMRDCTFSLVGDWGLDVDQHKTMTRPVKWLNQKQIVRRVADAYPSSALSRGEQAIVRLRVIVDENGAVEECVIGKVTDAKRLESPACKPMRDAKFEPALDKDGKPMRSYYQTGITYRIN
jgi:TonB family protein